jgi:hypothetical protein
MVFPIHSFLSPTSPFPTRWLPRLVRHFSRGTMRMLRLPAAPPVALRFSSNNGYLLASISFRSPRAPGVAPAAPGRWSTGFASTTPVLFMEDASRISQVPRVPFRAFALLLDPGRISTPSRLRRFDSAPAFRTTKAPAFIIISRLHHTAFAPLHTLRADIADDYAMFASGWWLAFAGWGCFPTGSLYYVSESFYPITLLFLTFWVCLTRPEF